MIAQEAKFKLIDLHDSNNDNSIGFIEYKVKLHDADGVEVTYNITDYYNDKEEIVDTRIWKLSDKILDDLHIKNDSRLGKKILTFVTNNHPFRGDTLEAMYVKEMEDKIDDYVNREY